MDGELNETTPIIYPSMWASTPHTVYKATTSTNITGMTRDMDLYQGRPSDTTHLSHPSWQTVQREKEWKEQQKQPHNQKRPRRQEPPWLQQRQPPPGQQTQRKEQWQSPQSHALQRKRKRQPRQRPDLQNKHEPPSKKRCDDFRGSKVEEREKFQQFSRKFPDPIPQTSSSALTWSEAVSSLSIEDPNAVYDPSEPTITEFDMPHEDSLSSITNTVELVSPYLEVAIVSVPATDLTRDRSHILQLKIGDLAELWAANSNNNIAVAFIGTPLYSEKDIGLYLRCLNGETIRWLENVVASLDPLWDGCKLLIRKCERQAKFIKSCIRLPICSTNLGLVCKALRGFNPAYHVQTWEFYSFQRKKLEQERNGCLIVVGIPEDILVREILPNQRRIKYRLYTCLIKFFTPQGKLVNKYPPIDEVDSASSSISKGNTDSAAPNKEDGRKISSTSKAVTIEPATVLETRASAKQDTDLSNRAMERTSAASCKTKDHTNAEEQPGSSEKKKEVPKPRWWNQKIEEKRKWMRHLFNRAKNTKREEDWVAYKQAQNEFKKMVRSGKYRDFQLIRD